MRKIKKNEELGSQLSPYDKFCQIMREMLSALINRDASAGDLAIIYNNLTQHAKEYPSSIDVGEPGYYLFSVTVLKCAIERSVTGCDTNISKQLVHFPSKLVDILKKDKDAIFSSIVKTCLQLRSNIFYYLRHLTEQDSDFVVSLN